MDNDRRSFLKLATAAGATLAAGRVLAQAGERQMPRVGPAGYKRIASEEAWGTREIFQEWKKVLDARPADEVGFLALWRNLDPAGNTGFTPRLMDLGETRIAAMDAAGIDMQILALTAPGVQVFDADMGTALAADSNDQLAEAVRKYPTRYAGMTAIAPQDPRRAALEIERGATRLGMKGIIVKRIGILNRPSALAAVARNGHCVKLARRPLARHGFASVRWIRARRLCSRP